MGNVVALPLCGLLCKYGFDEGWASIFYVIGGFHQLFILIIIWHLTPAGSYSKYQHCCLVNSDYGSNVLKILLT